MYEVNVEETFAAGHALRDYYGKCENVHGHNFRVRVTISGARLDATGLLVDFVLLRRVMGEVIQGLDHRHLNDQAPFDTINPSAENIARHFHEQLAGKLPAAENGARISAVTVWETDTASATYRP